MDFNKVITEFAGKKRQRIGSLPVKARGNFFNICSISLKDVDCWGMRTVSTRHSTFDSTKLHKKPGIQSQAAPAVVTMDTDSLLWIRTWI